MAAVTFMDRGWFPASGRQCPPPIPTPSAPQAAAADVSQHLNATTAICSAMNQCLLSVHGSAVRFFMPGFCFLFIPTSYRFHGEGPSQRGNQGAFMPRHISAGCSAGESSGVAGWMVLSVNCAVTQTIDFPVTEHILASRCSRWRRKQISAPAVIREVCVHDGLSTGSTSCVYIRHGQTRARGPHGVR